MLNRLIPGRNLHWYLLKSIVSHTIVLRTWTYRSCILLCTGLMRSFLHGDVYLITCSSNKTSRLVTKPTMWVCAQRRHTSVWASAQSESLLCASWVAKDQWFLHVDSMWTAKTLIRLSGCPGWSESLLDTQVILVCHAVAHCSIKSRPSVTCQCWKLNRRSYLNRNHIWMLR